MFGPVEPERPRSCVCVLSRARGPRLLPSVRLGVSNLSFYSRVYGRSAPLLKPIFSIAELHCITPSYGGVLSRPPNYGRPRWPRGLAGRLGGGALTHPRKKTDISATLGPPLRPPPLHQPPHATRSPDLWPRRPPWSLHDSDSLSPSMSTDATLARPGSTSLLGLRCPPRTWGARWEQR